VAATSIAKLAAPEGGDLDPGLDDLAAPVDDGRAAVRRGRAGTAVGRAVHAVLQTVDLATGVGLADLARTHAAAEGVADRAREIERLARAALDAPVIRDAVAGGRCWRELYVGVPVGDRVLEGFVDLLVDGPAGLVVVDYKTDAVPGDRELEAAVERYRLQAAAYAVAVEHALGRPVERCTFLFVRAGEAVSRDVADLDAARREVRELLSR
jgi:ATP-dependent exoDNAse (exonuclease V) beta subunit